MVGCNCFIAGNSLTKSVTIRSKSYRSAGIAKKALLEIGQGQEQQKTIAVVNTDGVR